MEIHTPKAAHSWREFLTEIGTIICGILIALSLEQAVEALHWREKVEHGRARLAGELKLLYFRAYERDRVNDCLDARLAQLRAALLSGEGRWTPLPPMHHPDIGDVPYYAPFRPWPEEIWKTLIADGTSSRLPEELEIGYMRTYTSISTIREQNAREALEATSLRLLGQPVDLTREERLRLAEIVERLRGQNKWLVSQIGTPVPLFRNFVPVDDREAERWFDDQSNAGRSCRALGLLGGGHGHS